MVFFLTKPIFFIFRHSAFKVRCESIHVPRTSRHRTSCDGNATLTGSQPESSVAYPPAHARRRMEFRRMDHSSLEQQASGQSGVLLQQARVHVDAALVGGLATERGRGYRLIQIPPRSKINSTAATGKPPPISNPLPNNGTKSDHPPPPLKTGQCQEMRCRQRGVSTTNLGEGGGWLLSSLQREYLLLNYTGALCYT